jgi:hypothetical protein
MIGRSVPRVVGLVGMWLTLMGFLGGMAVERIRFDQHRTSVLNRLHAAEARLHDRLMAIEKAAMRAAERSAPREGGRAPVAAVERTSAAP